MKYLFLGIKSRSIQTRVLGIYFLRLVWARGQLLEDKLLINANVYAMKSGPNA